MTRKISKKNKFLKRAKIFYKSVYKSCLKFLKLLKKKHKKLDYNYYLARMAFVSVITFLYFTGPSFIGITSSYYNDEETSLNIFTATVVDIELTNGDLETLESSLNFGSGTTTQKQIQVLVGPQSNIFIYHASTTNMTGDLDFCNDLSMDISLNGNPWQNGSTTNFISATTTLVSTSTPDLWDVTFKTKEASSTPNSVCRFDFTYNAFQNSEPILGGGFFDSEKLSTTIYSWGLRINKVYYDVESPKRGNEGDNEWVEIYNQTDTDIDITGWKICDNTACDTIPESDPIPGKGFAVITPDESTWDYWHREDDVISIVLGNDIGNGLANTNDMLVLKRPDGMIVDQMNWGTPSLGWANYNLDLWNPGPTAPEGYTLGRKPNGYDTNQSFDFVSLGPPLLNLIYPDQSGNLTWYWTYNYDITWTAENPNGLDSDLLIDLFYIKDLDGSASINEGDEEIKIADKISNTGLFNWEVPSGFIGYIWIKIIGFGPENPMLNTKITSGKIYDPAPFEILLKEPGQVENNEEETEENENLISGALVPKEVENITIEIVEESEDVRVQLEEDIEDNVEIQDQLDKSIEDTDNGDETKEDDNLVESIETYEEVKTVGLEESVQQPEPEQIDNFETPEVKEEETISLPEPEQVVLPEPEPEIDNSQNEE